MSSEIPFEVFPMQGDATLLFPIEHILLVDDEDDCNFVTKLVLKKAGFKGKLTCFTAADDAFQFLKSGETPDLMFVDINMPGTNGFDLLATVENEGILPNAATSVIMFSSSNRPSDLEKALSFRSVIGYVEKALTVENYERMVADHQRRMKR
ncbi:MAG: response regulator [Bacteroidota bacterium]|nr:response regulator [Bacteroidota bacterium]